MASKGNGNREPERVTRAALYVRVSTEDQVKEGFSLDGQQTRGNAYCVMRGWNLAKVYVEEGRSAKGIQRRPVYERMMAERDEWDVLLVLKLDRIWRNAKKFLEMVADLQANGKELASVMDNLDTTTPIGKFVQTLLAALAELESDQIRERVLIGMTAKFGKAVDAWQSRPPLGFAVQDGHLTLVESEAVIIRAAFELAASGKTIDEVVSDLTARGFHGKEGGRFGATTVSHILRNPVYAGYVYWDGMLRRNGHEHIVSDDTFNAAQIAIYSRTRMVGRNRWPLIVGAAGMTVERMGSVKDTRGRSAYYYVTSTRPEHLDALMASYARKVRPRARSRRPRVVSG